MSKEFEMKVAALRVRHEELLSRPNIKKECGNGYMTGMNILLLRQSILHSNGVMISARRITHT